MGKSEKNLGRLAFEKADVENTQELEHGSVEFDELK